MVAVNKLLCVSLNKHKYHLNPVCFIVLRFLLKGTGHAQVIAANTAPSVLWENMISVYMMSVCAATFVIAVLGFYVSVFVSSYMRLRDHRGLRRSKYPAHRGKNLFLEVYISTGICLMSARVERCIEHVRRPLAMRCG